MFSNLEDRFSEIFKKVRGQGTLTEKNIKDTMREVRLSLLEADVHFTVVKEFVRAVRERALGKEVSASLRPDQELLRIVHDELVTVMGGSAAQLDFKKKPPVVILLMGLQGSGKTTTAGKLALKLKAEGKKPLLVPADIHRPAAIAQLKTLADQVKVDVFDSQAGQSVDDIAKGALEQVDRQGHDVMIFDTAGRLVIDPEMMEELRQAKATIEPHYSLLVVDGMTGQDAVNTAGEFKNQVGIDGVVMTKLDGDARGGAALSVRKVTGAPIYYAGMGEKMDALEVFHPDRVAQRVLGMGDVMGLIEKSQQAYDEKKAKKMAKKIKKAEFTLEDFRDQMAMMRQMGDMKSIMNMIPGMSQAMKKMGPSAADPDKELRRIEAMICSMTPKERNTPEIIDGSRRKRIAAGSGTTVSELNQFLKRFRDAKKMMKRLAKMGPGGLKGLMGGFPGMGGGGMPRM